LTLTIKRFTLEINIINLRQRLKMQKDLNECTMQELVKIYNSHASIPVKGFHDKTTAKRE